MLASGRPGTHVPSPLGRMLEALLPGRPRQAVTSHGGHGRPPRRGPAVQPAARRACELYLAAQPRLMRLRRCVRKTLLILITQKQPTGTKDFAVYLARLGCALWKERSNQPPSLLL